MSAEEKYLIALGNLQSMAIDNTKGSKAVEICANDIRDYLDKYKQVLDKIKEYIENTDDFDIEIFDESSGGCLGTDLSKGAKHILELLEEIE